MRAAGTPSRDGMVSISEDSGAEHSFPLPEGSGEYSYPSIDGDRIIFNLDYDLGGGSVLTDLDGGELLRSGEYLSWLWQQYGETPSLPSTVDYISREDGSSYRVTCVCTRDGAPLLTAEGGVYLWNDRLLIADAGSYRLTDLGRQRPPPPHEVAVGGHSCGGVSRRRGP